MGLFDIFKKANGKSIKNTNSVSSKENMGRTDNRYAEEKAAFEKGFPLYEKGEEFRKNKEYEKALEQYDKAREVGYAVPALYRGYVRVYKQLKEYDKALACIDEAVEMDKVHHFNSSAFQDLLSEREKIEEMKSKK